MPVFEEKIQGRSWSSAIAEIMIAILVLFAVIMNKPIETTLLQAIDGDAITYMLLATLYTFCGSALLYFWSIATHTNSYGRLIVIVWAFAALGIAGWYLIRIVLP